MNESLVKKGGTFRSDNRLPAGCRIAFSRRGVPFISSLWDVTYPEQMEFELSTASHGKKTPSAPTTR